MCTRSVEQTPARNRQQRARRTKHSNAQGIATGTGSTEHSTLCWASLAHSNARGSPSRYSIAGVNQHGVVWVKVSKANKWVGEHSARLRIATNKQTSQEHLQFNHGGALGMHMLQSSSFNVTDYFATCFCEGCLSRFNITDYLATCFCGGYGRNFIDTTLPAI